MRWPDVAIAVYEAMTESAVLAAIFGDSITDTEERLARTPSLAYTIIANTETENFEPTLIQFNVWTRTREQQIIAEAELRRMFHRDTPYRIGALGVWSQYQGRTRLEGPQDGTLGVAVDYQFAPLRSKYVPAGES
jgi:hypothetical protein